MKQDFSFEEIKEQLLRYINEEDIELYGDFTHLINSSIENEESNSITFKLMHGNLILSNEDLSYIDVEPCQAEYVSYYEEEG